MDILVHDGKELNIKNTSTGVNRPRLEREHYGNVNIGSLYRDVNMSVRSQDGRVFIDALGIAGAYSSGLCW